MQLNQVIYIYIRDDLFKKVKSEHFRRLSVITKLNFFKDEPVIKKQLKEKYAT